jgi:hypothetical protein
VTGAQLQGCSCKLAPRGLLKVVSPIFVQDLAVCSSVSIESDIVPWYNGLTRKASGKMQSVNDADPGASMLREQVLGGGANEWPAVQS